MLLEVPGSHRIRPLLDAADWGGHASTAFNMPWELARNGTRGGDVHLPTPRPAPDTPWRWTTAARCWPRLHRGIRTCRTTSSKLCWHPTTSTTLPGAHPERPTLSAFPVGDQQHESTGRGRRSGIPVIIKPPGANGSQGMAYRRSGGIAAGCGRAGRNQPPAAPDPTS